MFFFKKLASSGIDATEAVKRANEGSLLLVDVRETGEIASTGKAKGAVHIPLMQLKDMADPRHPDFNPSLDVQTSIAVYCASGARSYSAKRVLRKLGYNDVHNIGGFGQWVQAGGAIEPE